MTSWVKLAGVAVAVAGALAMAVTSLQATDGDIRTHSKNLPLGVLMYVNSRSSPVFVTAFIPFQMVAAALLAFWLQVRLKIYRLFNACNIHNVINPSPLVWHTVCRHGPTLLGLPATPF